METYGGNIRNKNQPKTKMENLEIHSYQIKNEDDIQEYHEIIEETQFHSNIIASRKKLEANDEKPNEYDFFTGTNVRTSYKSIKKSKKPKKKVKSLNLMDVINCEIATTMSPVTENIIKMLDYNTKQRASLLKNNTILEMFKKSSWSESELRQKSEVINLSPTFPRVLENVIRENKEIQVEYVKPIIYNNLIINYKDTSFTTDETTFLDVTLKNLTFNHHHKFSLEKLLSIKLSELFKEYETINNSLKDLSRDIIVNRETKKNLKEDLIKINPNKANSIRFDPIIRKYTGKLLQLKEIYMDTLKSKKEIIHKIQSLWSDIEMVRIKSKCTLTSCILNINEQEYNKDELEKQWIDLFNLEFTEALDKIEYDYVSKYLYYKEAKNEQKMENSTRKNIVKPKLIIDEVILSEKVEKIVSDIMTYNKIELVLKEDKNIISDYVKSRIDISDIIYCFEIYVDDIFVCESEKYEGKFHIAFNEMFSIQILPNNKNISIVLMENDDTVSRIVIDLIEMKKNINKPEFIKEKFSYNITIKPTSRYVGSGNTIKEIAIANKVRLKSCGLFQNPLYTTAEVYVQMKWNVKLSENYTEEIKSTVKIGAKIKRILHGIDKPHLDTLKDLIKDLFGKDVTDDEIMLNSLKDICKTEIKIDYTFPIDVNSPKFVRFKLIHVRNKGGFASLENSMIPLNASQISTEQLNCLQKVNAKDLDIDYLTDNEIDMDPIELQRFIGTKYIERLNTNMLKNLNYVLLRRTYKDVVREFYNFGFRYLLKSPLNFTLGSLSNITKQQILRESLDKQQDIKITVLRAFNLLDRSVALLEDADDDDRIAGFKMRPLRPFVRVSYHGIAVQTVPAIGCHPCWNHTLTINTKLSPLSSLHINIYDEYKDNVTEDRSDDEHYNKTIQYKYYKKWLGTLEVPMYNVLALGTLRGTFKITTPPMTIGYENSQTKVSTSIVPEINQLLKKETSFLALQITTDLAHLGGIQHYNQPTNPSDDDLIKHLNIFTTQYTNDFPFRSISLTFIDSDGKNKCVTEFLQAIPLPNPIFFPINPKRCESAVSKSSGVSKSSSSKSSEKREIDVERGEKMEDRYSVYSGDTSGDVILKMIHTCMRYVALIPSYEITESHSITLTGLELLRVLHGSPLDHTILLASYFLYLEIKCWVVIGLGLPRGPSSYVLIKYDLGTNRIVKIHDQQRRRFFDRNDGCLLYIFDSISGEKFELREVGCPLKTADYVFNNENIWVNVQSSQDCDSMSFDFSRSTDWEPVFQKPLFIPKSVPRENSLYSKPPDVESLRDMLESKIKTKVQKWRPHVKTIWNRYCGTLLRESLPQWEYWAFNPMEQKPGLGQKLKQLMITHKMFGFPLNIPFTSTKAVISRVKSTGLHQNDDPNVEFAVGVELYSYPNNVISVWVYLATITKI